jgi:hypothetical protein
MAWPKKGTRTLTVDGVEYLWHHSGHCPACSDEVYTMGMAGRPFVLFIDPLPWHFELTPSSMITAIRWAIHNGWTPDKGPTRAMSWDQSRNDFVWLPEGKRHLSCKIET